MPSGIIPGVPINVFGKYLSGKTLLTLQEATNICSQEGGNILLLDVDGNGNIYAQEWKPIFQERFGFKGEIYVLPSFNTQRFDERQKQPYFDLNIFTYFGVKSQVTISQHGKANFTAYQPVPSLVNDYIVKKGVKVIIIDSFSQIFKDVFVGTESFGERARAEDFLFGEIKTVIYNHPNVYMFINHHQSANPITGQVSLAGGSSVLQNSKIAIYINKFGEKSNTGELYIYRYPTLPPWSRKAPIVYTDIGLVDPQ